MATIIEDYVSFETAKLLKEKGMDKSCFKHYVQKKNNNDGTSEAVTVCTLQMAMKWLREVHNITIGITFSCDVITYEIHKNGDFITAVGSSRPYENVVEAACVYALKNLISMNLKCCDYEKRK